MDTVTDSLSIIGVTSCAASSSVVVDPDAVSAAPQRFHTGCWRLIAEATRHFPGLEAQYAVGNIGSLPLVNVARSVTCPDCQDSFVLAGPGYSIDILCQVRRAMLARSW